MLGILTAAETEMYESSKRNEETQNLQKAKPEMRDAQIQFDGKNVKEKE
jgi:hypothetical protein